MQIHDFYRTIAEEREIHLAEHPVLEARIAKHLGIASPKPQTVWSLFLTPALAMAALVGMTIFAPNTVDAAQQAAVTFFFQYGAANITVPSFTLLGIIGGITLTLALILIMLLRKQLANPTTRIMLTAVVLAIGVIPLIMFGLSRITHTVRGTITSASCANDTITLTTETVTTTLSLPPFTMPVTDMNGEVIGGYSASAFCDTHTGSYFLSGLKGITFDVTVNGRNQVVALKALAPVPALGGIAQEDDVTLLSYIWGNDNSADSRAEATLFQNGVEFARVDYSSAMVWPYIVAINDTHAIIAMRSELGCDSLVYQVDRATGDVTTVEPQGCLIGALEDGTIVFSGANTLTATYNTIVTETWNLEGGIGKVATRSPDGTRLAILSWDGTYDAPTGAVSIYTPGSAPVTIDTSYWETVTWEDTNTISVAINGGDTKIMSVK